MYVDWNWWMENPSRITYVKKKKKKKMINYLWTLSKLLEVKGRFD